MRKVLCIILALGCVTAAWGQQADLRKGNRQFKKEKYAEADISYRKGLMLDTTSVAAHYNLANNLYRQQNMEEAAKQLDAVQMTASGEKFAADYYFNRGDVAIAQQDWQTAVNMFKESLRLRPEDLEAKENYIYARNKLMEQQQNQDQQNQDQQNQDQQNQDQQNQNQQNQDQQNQDQNQDQDQNKDQNQDQQDQNQNQDQNQDQQQQQPQLSPQQAQQLLQAIQDKEKQTQEKVDEKKAQALKSRQKEKNW